MLDRYAMTHGRDEMIKAVDLKLFDCMSMLKFVRDNRDEEYNMLSDEEKKSEKGFKYKKNIELYDILFKDLSNVWRKLDLIEYIYDEE